MSKNSENTLNDSDDFDEKTTGTNSKSAGGCAPTPKQNLRGVEDLGSPDDLNLEEKIPQKTTSPSK